MGGPEALVCKRSLVMSGFVNELEWTGRTFCTRMEVVDRGQQSQLNHFNISNCISFKSQNVTFNIIISRKVLSAFKSVTRFSATRPSIIWFHPLLEVGSV